MDPRPYAARHVHAGWRAQRKDGASALLCHALAEQVLVVVKGVGVDLGDLLLHQVDGCRVQIIVAGLLVLEVLGPQVGQANGAELVNRAVALRELLELNERCLST